MSSAKLLKLVRFTITFIVLGAAVFLGLMLWHNYMNSPWTRDGRVRADTVLIAPDVSGIVTEVKVHDNQYVKQGEPLFIIDQERYDHQVHEARALVQTKKLEYEMKRHQSQRRQGLNDEEISQENKDDAALQTQMAKAQYDQALAQLQTALLNFERATVRSPINGWVTNLLLKKGDFLKVGDNKLAIIVENSFWVYGYFEEHKIPLLHEGDKATMKLLGTPYTLQGHIESIAKGITDRDNATGDSLLANVNPTFTWVRLAQRIPVRIHIDTLPKDVHLAAGMTCSVSVTPRHKTK